MIFLLSKLVALFLSPLTWVLVLLLGALLWKKPERKRLFLRLGLAVLIIFSNPALFNIVSKTYESSPVTLHSIASNYDYIIILGGFTNMDAEEDITYQMSHEGNRLLTGMELYKRGKAKKIVISGGSGNIWKPEEKEADSVQDFLLKQGIDSSDIIIENQSRNTYENAVFTKKILDSIGVNSKSLLVTSAFHMPRSKAIFDKLNMNTTPYPTGFYHRPLDAPKHTMLPNGEILKKWNILIKEWVGYLSYRVMGRL